MLCSRLQDAKGLAEHAQQVLLLAPSVRDVTVPDELLYGRAGYLYCLLVLRKLAKEAGGTKAAEKERRELESLSASISKVISEVFDQLVIRGKEFARQQAMDAKVPLMYAWHGRKYLGGCSSSFSSPRR